MHISYRKIDCISVQASLIFDDHTTESSASKTRQIVPVNPTVWTRFFEFVCYYYLAPILTSKSEHRVKTSIFLTHTSLAHKDWLQEYKKDANINLLLNHLSISTKPFDPELIKGVHKCYRVHLRENRIHLLDNKLVWYIPIGGDNRLVKLIIAPKI